MDCSFSKRQKNKNTSAKRVPQNIKVLRQTNISANAAEFSFKICQNETKTECFATNIVVIKKKKCLQNAANKLLRNGAFASENYST